MSLFGGKEKKKINELEAQVKQLEAESKENARIAQHRLDIINNNTSSINRLRTELDQGKGDKSKLQSQLWEAEESRREYVRLANNEAAESRAEASNFINAEKRAQEIKAQLLFKEKELLEFVRQSKLLAAHIIQKLRLFMTKYEFLKYPRYDISMGYVKGISEDKRKNLEYAHRNVIYPAYGNHSEEQIQEAKKRNVNLGRADENLQNSLRSLIRVTNLLSQLESLLSDQIRENDQWIKGTSVYLESVNQEYGHLISSDTLPKYNLSKFDENILKALKEGLKQEKAVEKLNDTIEAIIRQIITQLNITKSNLSAKSIGIFFKEFDNLQPDLLNLINQLFTNIVSRINRNTELCKRLTEQEDDELKEIQKNFGVYLNNEKSNLGLALSKAAKRQK